MFSLRTWSLSALLFLGAGCFGTSKYSHQDAVVVREDLLRETAAFDLSCKPEDLAVTQLGNSWGATVVGCGERARYVYSPNSGLWIANSATR
jgi:hypothetical protein